MGQKFKLYEFCSFPTDIFCYVCTIKSEWINRRASENVFDSRYRYIPKYFFFFFYNKIVSFVPVLRPFSLDNADFIWDTREGLFDGSRSQHHPKCGFKPESACVINNRPLYYITF